MNKFVKKEDGLTLVELLAVLAIGSIILFFISTIHIFIQNQYNSQSKEVNELNDITIAMRAITKDIRTADVIQTSEDSKEITITIDGEETTYQFENNNLKRNGVPYIYDLEDFEATFNASKIQLKIVSVTGKMAETEIVMRGAE